jgi:ribosomal protein S18 acetylase RimI-like enzyme
MPARPRLRPLRPADIDACARIVAADPLWRRYGVTLARARRAFRRAVSPRPSRTLRGTRARPAGGAGLAAGEVAVADRGGRVLGFIWFHRLGTFAHSGYVRWIGVAADARGQGIGDRLMRYAERRVFRAGANVFLMVSHFNRRAQAFYRRLGYTRVGAVPDYVVPGITEYVYRKTRGPAVRRGRKAAGAAAAKRLGRRRSADRSPADRLQKEGQQ